MTDRVRRVLRDIEALRHAARALLDEYRRVRAEVAAAAARLEPPADGPPDPRVGIRLRDEAAAPLVAALHRLVDGDPDVTSVHEFAERVDAIPEALLQDVRRAARWRPFPRRGRRMRGREAIGRLRWILDDRRAALLRSPGLLADPVPADEARCDFERRPAHYHAVLAHVAGVTPEGTAAEGFLPEELAQWAWLEDLDETHLKVSLRTYQSFGARFAVMQGRVILGDAPGLGKTVQAIAAIAHRRAEGATHFLVACPATVLLNWVRDIEAHSSIAAHPLRGPDRDAAVRRWIASGGVAVAPLSALPRLRVPPGLLGMFVVDEADHTKDRGTRHAAAVTGLCHGTENVMLLTGIPLEGRVEEFRSLLAHLPPETAERVRPVGGLPGARAFRAAVAPVYLRREQRDVLAELPDIVRVDELVAPGRADRAMYREAAGDVTALRRAGYAVPGRSAKLRRLRELVGEAAANDAKVAVLSCFREVLYAVAEALGPGALGPVTTEAAAGGRDAVDAFTAATGHAVLLAGIRADGPDLGAASVVIICEPQEDPRLEARAIGRAHGAGRPGAVRVHRLVAPGAADERIGGGTG
ncbi:SNF2-related protein [Actinomadura sp. GTD37]|uniref:SNF2-related protein n=1 Tax=Actinomadura sp. GTD37 TaxID=1778030 RepID=UPI0035BF80A2